MNTFKIKKVTKEVELEIVKLYTINNLQIMKIRDICGIGARRISKILIKHNIPIKKGGITEKQAKVIKIVNDNKEKILKNYLIDKMNISQIARKFGIHIPYLWGFLKKNRIDIRYCHGRQHDIDESYFENIDTHEKAYWLGWLFSDGYLLSDLKTVGMNLSIKDESVLEDFKRCLKSGGNILRFPPPKKKSKIKGQFVKGGIISSFRFTNDKIAKNLMKFGLKPMKSLTLEWPHIEHKFYYDFIRGYLEGDGCICIDKNNRYSVTILSSEGFLKRMQDFIMKDILFKMNIYCVGKIFAIRTGNKKNILTFLDKVYKNSDKSPRLDRKYQKYLLIKEQLLNKH